MARGVAVSNPHTFVLDDAGWKRVDAPQAEFCLQRSLATARRQGARLWELRAACSLGRLWRDQGKHDDARALLGPIHGGFAEGFDTPDLKEARALLDALSGA